MQVLERGNYKAFVTYSNSSANVPCQNDYCVNASCECL